MKQDRNAGWIIACAAAKTGRGDGLLRALLLPSEESSKKEREPNAKGRRDKIRTGPALCVILLVHFFPGCFLLRWLNTAFHFEFALFKIR